MTSRVSNKTRLDILVDRPLLSVVTDILHDTRVTGHTVLPALEGEGAHGPWYEDQISGSQRKVMVICVAEPDTADRVLTLLEPLLDSHGIVVMTSQVGVVRGSKFA